MQCISEDEEVKQASQMFNYQMFQAEHLFCYSYFSLLQHFCKTFNEVSTAVEVSLLMMII